MLLFIALASPFSVHKVVVLWQASGRGRGGGGGGGVRGVGGGSGGIHRPRSWPAGHHKTMDLIVFLLL